MGHGPRSSPLPVRRQQLSRSNRDLVFPSQPGCTRAKLLRQRASLPRPALLAAQRGCRRQGIPNQQRPFFSS
eukprot:scaffold154_cov373-Prasinococcus_capsulatus_cf.AAC.16